VTGREVRELRRRLGLSQTELSNRLGVTQGTVSNWETGRTAPTPTYEGPLQELARAAQPDGATTMTSPDVSFGTWVRDQRTRQGMTSSQLSALSGVSMPQIYNIETGRTANPRLTTRRALEAHLGGAPAQVEQAVKEQFDIPDVGEMTSFDPHNAADFPDEPGIYVLYDISDRPIYVGESENIRNRIRNSNTGHIEKFWYKSPIVETAAYVRVPNSRLRRQLEQTLIKFLRSNAVINKKGVDRPEH
jgi:transcriptional regulator with XRE-family HTH domain